MAVQNLAGRLGGLGPQPEGALHRGPPQIEVSVLQASLLASLLVGVLGDLEGKRGGGVEDDDVGSLHLDLAR